MSPFPDDATFIDRTFAYLIDLIPISLVIGIIYAPKSLDTNMLNEENILPPPQTAIPVIILISWSYFLLTQILNKGQSPGQYLMKLRIISDEKLRDYKKDLKSGKRKEVNKRFVKALSESLVPSPIKSTIHAFGKVPFIAPIDLIIGYILYRNDGGKQRPTRFLQGIARTRVISIK